MSTVDYEVVDARYDPEPACWTELRKLAGLRADWSWDVLAAQAWCVRAPQLLTVLHGTSGPCGVVCAYFVGTRWRRNRFVPEGRGGAAGILDVRAPGNATLPGWWFAEQPSAGCRRLLDGYARHMRRRLGVGLRGLLLRQVGDTDLHEVAGRFRLTRRTEDVGVLHLSGRRGAEDWVATLSRSRRQNLRSIARALDADPAVEVRVRHGGGEDPIRLAELLRHNVRKYRDVPVPPLPKFIGYLERLLPQPDVATISYTDRVTGHLLGICVILDHPDWPLAWSWASLPVSEGGRQGLYFDMYSVIVRYAIETGKRGVLLGKAMADLKRTMGAELVRQFGVAVPLW